MNNTEIIFYTTPNGTIPVEDFLRSLNDKMRIKVMRTILLLKEFGNTLREPYSKHIEDGIFELRTKIGSDITRVLYFFISGNKVILTNGFVKKTQKTPKQEIELAKKYKKQYLQAEV